MSRLGVTPSQTVGPYFSIGLTWADGADVVAPGTPGAIRVYGVVYDGSGEPIPDAVIETWQADADGRFPGASPGFRGLGRAGTDDGGRWQIRTVKPGRVSGHDGNEVQAPHIDVTVLARGLLARLVTRIYFGDEPDANDSDPLLSSLPAGADVRTLIAVPDGDGGYTFDIRLQGEGETVFFEL